MKHKIYKNPRKEKQQEITGSSLRENLIEECLPLVKKIVNRLNHLFNVGEISEDDLLGYGIVGMIEAVDKYDESKGNINSFVAPRIKGAIYDHLRKLDHLKRTSRTKSKKLNRIISELEQELGRSPFDHEIAKCMEVSVAELHQIQQDITMNFISLDSSMGEDNDDDFSSMVSDKSLSPEETYEKKDLLEKMQLALGELPEKEKTIIGLYHYRKMNMKEIAKLLGISESRVCQLHHRGISILRSKLEKYT